MKIERAILKNLSSSENHRVHLRTKIDFAKLFYSFLKNYRTSASNIITKGAFYYHYL